MCCCYHDCGLAVDGYHHTPIQLWLPRDSAEAVPSQCFPQDKSRGALRSPPAKPMVITVHFYSLKMWTSRPGRCIRFLANQLSMMGSLRGPGHNGLLISNSYSPT